MLQPNIQQPLTNHYFVRSKKNLKAAKRFYSSTANDISGSGAYAQACEPSKLSIHPWALTGFIDGEGSFIISISKHNSNKVGWQVKLEFWLSLHKGDLAILESIQCFLGVGNIFNHPTKKIIHYRITAIKDLAILLTHLDKYPLMTQKRADYELFKSGYNLVLNKQHLIIDGLVKIVALKASINLGLSDDLKAAFPNVTSEIRPIVENKTIANTQWLAGFATAEGCFFL